MPHYKTDNPNLTITFGVKEPRLVRIENGKAIIASPQHESDEPMHIDVYEYDLSKKEKAQLIKGHLSTMEFEKEYNIRHEDCSDLDLLKAYKVRVEDLDIPRNTVVLLGKGSKQVTPYIKFDENSSLVFSENSSVSFENITLEGSDATIKYVKKEDYSMRN